MHVALRFSRRVRTTLVLAVVATTLGLVPGTTAEAAPAAVTGSVECSAAQAAHALAQRQQGVARAQVVKARKALAKARKTRRAAKIRQARKALTRATATAAGRARAVADTTRGVGYACAAPTSAAPTSAARAYAVGKELGILAGAAGIPAAPIERDQLLALLDRFLPGVASRLTADQVEVILAGFGLVADGTEVSPSEAYALLGGAFTPTQVAQLLDGPADSPLLTGLVVHLRTQLGVLAAMTPPLSFDPSAALDTLAGIFGTLDPAQLGKLLALLTAIADGDGPSDTEGLGALLEALSPGLSATFDEDQLNAMLAAITSGTPTAAVVANLLGGRVTAEQIGALLQGVADPELAGEVIALVLAQLSAHGGGELTPVATDPAELVALFEQVTGQLQEFFCSFLLLCL